MLSTKSIDNVVTLENLTLDDIAITDYMEVDEIIEATPNQGVNINGSVFKDGVLDLELKKVNTLYEKTTNAGVTIEGVKVKDNALYLGGLTTALNYYETWTTSTSVRKSTNTAQNFFTTSETITFTLVKIGPMICCSYSAISGLVATDNTQITCLPSLPTRFRPVNNMQNYGLLESDSVVGLCSVLIVSGDGSIKFYPGTSADVFPTAGVLVSVYPNSVWWSV